MYTGEARLSVRAISESNPLLGQDIPVESLGQLLLDGSFGPPEPTANRTNPVLDKLKVAEYGVLVKPITTGVELFLEQLPSLPLPEAIGLTEIADIVGEHIFTNTWKAIEDAGLEETLTRLANLRASKVNHPGYANLIAPLRQTLSAAAVSSANNMSFAVAANAFAIQMSPDGRKLTHEDQVAIAKASHNLALSHPLVHLGDMGIVTLILNDFCGQSFRGKKFREDILKYDPNLKMVVMSKPIKDWHTGTTKTIADSGSENEDVRIGCPFSFAPKDTRVGFYEAIADLIDKCGHWPQTFASLVKIDLT